MIDLRSDTVTKPTPAMREAIAAAEVGDDVVGIDPTVRRLELRIAEILGKEAAIFMPSGTMTNQVAVRIHCGRRDEFICEEGCHIYNYEQGGYAQLSGLAVRPVQGQGGVLRVPDVEHLVRRMDEHMVQTKLLCLENTHNRAGGTIQPFDVVADLCNWAASEGLVSHLDGARLFNAIVATGIEASRWAKHFDSVSVCFSKGLGAPVGSALAGTAEFVAEARWHRKLFGGGMRQSGIIAAGALYALDHHIERLAEDHSHALILANAIQESEHLELLSDRVETNIVMFSILGSNSSATDFVALLEQAGVATLALGSNRVRLVTHLDVSRQQVTKAAAIIQEASAKYAERICATG